MTTTSKEALMTQFADRLAHEDHEKFKQECLDQIHERRAAKERQDKEADKPAASADH